ncbi:thiol methyltransferase [Coccidioides immitis RS]|uniref:Thiol methyltransferase n=1 Tax=Coccidioides immitis (strain RS) TaxID=246410 RepID=J3K7D9_COCIM|nr:thiol methyltransferase [Coccidioides immitis RS]EAS30608.3 thiol methyltransferase [Coccidioides immitis RS]
MAGSESIQCPHGQTRLIKHFETRAVENHGDGWSLLWDTDNSDLWDRGKPSPALIDLIEERRDLFSPFTIDGKRKKALVPGCGKGYDVVMLALHGYDVYGLEVSATGVSVAQEYAKNELANPQSYNFGSSWEEWQEAGEVTIIHADFFKSGWEGMIKFDVIYDYTFLCALHPSMRRQWASRMVDLLSPTGQVVCLEFPLWKDPSLPGPPWGLTGVHWNLMVDGGDGIVGEAGAAQGDKKGAFSRALYIKPTRSYENGRGTDMLSVYIKKS